MNAEEQLRSDLAESDELLERLTAILSEIANVLHGGPHPNGFWSWHDLPERAEALMRKQNDLWDSAREMAGALAALLYWDVLTTDGEGKGVVVSDAPWARDIIQKALTQWTHVYHGELR